MAAGQRMLAPRAIPTGHPGDLLRFRRCPLLVGDARRRASPDVRDGLLCALSAACYERTRLRLGVLPEVVLPPDDERIRVEGWIYAPRPATGLTVET